jgi:hypothetical protein
MRWRTCSFLGHVITENLQFDINFRLDLFQNEFAPGKNMWEVRYATVDWSHRKQGRLLNENPNSRQEENGGPAILRHQKDLQFVEN